MNLSPVQKKETPHIWLLEIAKIGCNGVFFQLIWSRGEFTPASTHLLSIFKPTHTPIPAKCQLASSPAYATHQKGETIQIAGQVFWWSLEHILLNWLLFWLKDKGHIHCKSMPGIWQKGNASLAKEHHYTREHNTKWASVYSPLQTLGRNYNATDIVISKKRGTLKIHFSKKRK